MRDIIINQIKNNGWMDYAFKRGDDDAVKFRNYKEWLGHLSDEDLLAAYDRVQDFERNLD